MDTLEEHADALEGVRVHQMHALHERPYIHGALRRPPAPRLLLPLGAPRDRRSGTAAATSCRTTSPRCRSCCGRARADPLVLAAASPPDRHGYFSLGTNADYVAALIGTVPFFLEVNARMPRTFGLNQIHASRGARLVRGRPAAGRGAAGRARRARPGDRGRHRRAHPRPGDAAGRHRRHPERGAGGAARPPRPRHPHRAARRRHRRPRRVRRRDRHAQAAAPQQGRGDVLPRYAAASTTGCTTTARSSCCRSTSSTIRAAIAKEDDFISINATTEVDLYGQCASETIAGPLLVVERRSGRLRARGDVLQRRQGVHRAALDDAARAAAGSACG